MKASSAAAERAACCAVWWLEVEDSEGRSFALEIACSVAAEGASQFLQMDSVNSEDLAELFDRIGWLLPHSFTQTLRNAARSKFRWLERVPGRSGHYSVTALGRSIILNP